MTAQAVQKRKTQPPQATTPMQMLEAAVQANADLDKMKMLMDLSDRWDAKQAKQAFHAAMSAFRGESIEIVKRKRANFGQTSYDYADLADVVDSVVPALSKHGLSHDWTMTQENGHVAVTCTLTHEAGHSKSTTLQAEPDTSGKKNAIQAIASTISYLEKYTFLAITGLAARGMDDDGQGAGNGQAKEATIDEGQAEQIKDLLKKAGKDNEQDMATFLKWASVERVEDIPVRNYEFIKLKLTKAVKELEAAEHNQENDDA